MINALRHRIYVLSALTWIMLGATTYGKGNHASPAPTANNPVWPTLACTTPNIYTAYPSVNSVQLAWDNVGSPAYQLDWRVAGATTWPNSLTVNSNSYELTGLNGITSYEVRVKALCADGSQSAYSTIAGFTTLACQPPTNLRESTIGPTTADLAWDKPYPVSTVFQWRVAGTTTWPNSYSLPANGGSSYGYSLTGLTTGTAYEWRIKAVCSPTDESAFTSPRSFTAQCSPPGLIYGSDVSATAATVYWADIQPYNYGVRWRVAGSNTAWTESPTIAGNFYTITGLVNAVTYEWQVRMICSGTPTGWSALNTFATQCSSTYIYGIIPTATSATFNVATRPAVRYRIEYRGVGTTTWPNAFTTTESTALSLSGLTPNTNYEAQSTVLCADGSQAPPPYTSTFTTLPAADLSLAMAVSKRAPRLSEVVVFSITVKNSGPQAANNVVAQSLLPPNMTFVGSAQGAVSHNNGTVNIAVGTVPAPGSATFSFSALATAPGIYRTAAQLTESSVYDPDSYLNSGTADGDDDAATVDLRTRETGNTIYVSPNPIFRILPPVQTNQPAPGATEADLSLGLQSDVRSLSAGARLNLSVVVANRGALGATGVVVQLTLPAGWQLAAGSGFTQVGQTVTLPAVSVGLNQLSALVVPLTVAGSGEQTLRALITAAAQPDLDSSHSNAFGLGEDDEATVSVRVR
ncbi:fibronectin type III domain-containing protein [Fibrella aquatilis]|uniref:Fibronectin type III domain-containing protein n=1 Tax=Fibrella aquatilis TaxID=2817059 RepID=A0A939K2H9_9BACT|nr:fibronectin type III domain-containing protein [Fibrella aquatilis]MBO0933325.1 fibronectin type III domain-containing protein [Fibrella aquatilis]